MADQTSTAEHHIVISADTHCGADLRSYKPYLEKKYHDDFDVWADHMEQQAEAMAERMAAGGRSMRNVGIDGDPAVDADRNFGSERRLREQEADGVVAAVLFPNTQPPFAPAAATAFEAPPLGDNYAHRWAGLQAHNRWLVDLVADAPERRAGIAQINLFDIDAAVQEIEWAAENNLRGGILLPGAPPDSGLDPHYAAKYDRIWAACAANDLPLNCHAGGGSPNYGDHFPASLAMFMLEVTWWNQRATWLLLFSGVFERHPNLKFVTTESGTAWVLDTLQRLDEFYTRMKFGKYGSETVIGGMAVAEMSMKPSEYWQRQCYIGASFLRPIEIGLRHSVGMGNLMWGSDYPHMEGSHPFTKQHLKLTFGGVPIEETTQILTTNTAEIYKFDLKRLAPLAEQFCPTKDEIFAGITYAEIPEEAKSCPGLQPHAQIQGS
ncbi:MAG: amidohydrolase [Acidimicrobiales bacterium]|nr:amidohydrolase [Acidimicrobiales bacterium]